MNGRGPGFPRLSACALCLVVVTPLHAQRSEGWLARVALSQVSMPNLSTPTGRPGLQPVRVGAEVVTSLYSGIGGFLLGRSIGGSVTDMLFDVSEPARERIADGTGLVIGGLATAGSVYGIGSIGDQTGSFGHAAVGAGAGYVAGVAVRWLINGVSHASADRESSRMRWMSAAVESLLPAIGATVAFNSTRRYR